MSDTALVIGGANTDIIGFPHAALVPHDSNPGHVRSGPGGVGRNIAENLARLGVRVDLVTAVGDDAAGRAMMDACREAGISTKHVLVAEGMASSTYVAIMDEAHDLEVAINDMRVLDLLGAEHMRHVASALPEPGVVVLDANLPREAIEAAVELWPESRILLDPVSVPKASRATRVLGRIGTLKANELEASELSGVDIHDEETLERAVAALLRTGIGRVFVSRGDRGVYCARAGERATVAAPQVNVANTTGAGDAFAAGVAYATLQGWSLEESSRFASAVAAITLSTERTVNEQLTFETASAIAKGPLR